MTSARKWNKYIHSLIGNSASSVPSDVREEIQRLLQKTDARLTSKLVAKSLDKLWSAQGFRTRIRALKTMKAGEVHKKFLAMTREGGISIPGQNAAATASGSAEQQPRPPAAAKAKAAAKPQGKATASKDADKQEVPGTLVATQWPGPILTSRPTRGSQGVHFCTPDQAWWLMGDFKTEPSATALAIVVPGAKKELEALADGQLFQTSHPCKEVTIIVKLKGTDTEAPMSACVWQLSGVAGPTIEILQQDHAAIDIEDAVRTAKHVVCLAVWEQHAPADIWSAALKALGPKAKGKAKEEQTDDSRDRHRTFVEAWVQQVDSNAIVYRAWSPKLFEKSGGKRSVSVLAVVTEETSKTLRAGSGKDGKFCWIAHLGDATAQAAEDKAAPIVWFKSGTDLPAALAVMDTLDGQRGLVPAPQRLGVRVAAEHHEAASLRIVGSLTAPGRQKSCTVRGVPLELDGEALQTALAKQPFGWEVTFDRMFDTRVGRGPSSQLQFCCVVRAAAPPPKPHVRLGAHLCTIAEVIKPSKGQSRGSADPKSAEPPADDLMGGGAAELPEAEAAGTAAPAEAALAKAASPASQRVAAASMQVNPAAMEMLRGLVTEEVAKQVRAASAAAQASADAATAAATAATAAATQCQSDLAALQANMVTPAARSDSLASNNKTLMDGLRAMLAQNQQQGGAPAPSSPCGAPAPSSPPAAALPKGPPKAAAPPTFLCPGPTRGTRGRFCTYIFFFLQWFAGVDAAAHPLFTIQTANVTSALGRAPVLAAWAKQAHIAAVQETKLGSKAQVDFASGLKASDSDICSARWKAVCLPGVAHIATFYGISGVRSYRAGLDFTANERHLRAVFAWGEAQGGRPVIITCDFNADADASPVLAAALSTDRWYDCGASMGGVSPTYYRSEADRHAGVGGSRIDLIIVNAAAHAALRRFRRADFAVPLHCALTASFDFGSLARERWIVLAPAPLGVSALARDDIDSEGPKETAAAVWANVEPQFYAALGAAASAPAEEAQALVNEAMTLWSDAAQLYLRLRVGDVTGVVPPDDGARRCRAPRFQKQRIVAPYLHKRPELGAATQPMLQAEKLLRCLRQLRAKQRRINLDKLDLRRLGDAAVPTTNTAKQSVSSPFWVEYYNLLGNTRILLRRLEGPPAGPDDEGTTRLHLANVNLGTCTGILAAEEATDRYILDLAHVRRQLRCRRWADKMHAATSGRASAPLFRHIKQAGGVQEKVARHLRRPDGSLTVDPLEMHKMCKETWHAIFNIWQAGPAAGGPDHVLPAAPSWENYLHQLRGHIPTATCTFPEFDERMLRRKIASMDGQRAAGAVQRQLHVQKLFFGIGGAISDFYQLSNGFGQGDSFAILVTTAHMAVWTRLVEAGGLSTGGFFDDSHLAAASASLIREGVSRSLLFDELSGQQTNMDKTVAFGTSAELTGELGQITINGTPLRITAVLHLLGACLPISPGPEDDVSIYAADRYTSAFNSVRRVATLPVDFGTKCQLISTGALSKLYGMEYSTPSEKQLTALGTAVLDAAWGDGRYARSRAVFFTVLTRGHMLDPWQCLRYNTIRTWLRYLRSSAAGLRQFTAVRSLLVAGGSGSFQGPTARLLQYFEDIEWNLFNVDILITHSGEPIRWLELQRGAAVVDVDASAALLRAPTKLTKLQRGILRTYLAGAVNTQDRLGAIAEETLRRRARGAAAAAPGPAGAGGDPPAPASLTRVCQLCGEEVETTDHILERCSHPAIVAAREEWTTPDLRELGPSLPTCARLCGLAVEDPRDEAARLALPPVQGHGEPPPRLETDDAVEIFTADGFLIAAGDGACHHQHLPLARRAGFGAFYGRNHSANFGLPLRGCEQTAQRAEVAACARVLAHSWRPTEYWTDSDLVFLGFERLLAGLRPSPEHCDLWANIATAYHAKGGSDHFRVRKVRGHDQNWEAEDPDNPTDDERQRMLEALMNAGADRRAVAGSDQRAPCDDLVRRVAVRATVTRAVQRRAVAILEARGLLLEEAGRAPHQQMQSWQQAQAGDQPPADQQPGQHHFPEYPWEPIPIVGNTRPDLTEALPPLLNRTALKSGIGICTHWRYPDAMLLSLHWYWSTLQFPVSPQPGDVGATFLELALDYMYATHVVPQEANAAGVPKAHRLQEYFASASRRLAQICRSTRLLARLKPGGWNAPSRRVLAARRLELPDLHGVPVRPRLLCPQHVATAMLHIARLNGSNRTQPKQMPQVTVGSLPYPLWSPPGSDGPAAQPLQGEARGSAPAMPRRRGPSQGATFAELLQVAWTPEEQQAIAVAVAAVSAQGDRFGQAIRRQKEREMKRLLHNRTAVAEQRHVVLPLGGRQGQCLRCEHCDRTAVADSFASFLRGRCLGREAPQTNRQAQIQRAKREDRIETHNQQAEAEQRHHLGLQLHQGKELLQCSRCKEFMPMDGRGVFPAMTTESCILLLPAAEQPAALARRQARYAQMRALGVEPLAAAARAD
ncbi:unnamed protein product [Prorocentrum cordatum]|uniref:RNase H type-1 domain-containing protein n=1 Tax=Prorocentrum cordatum TaxID=2364126 RepID=A0ABN9WLS3_9DINO|nr:unnamed protein product [Polarella glacialis]